MAYARGLIPISSAANNSTFQVVTMLVESDYATSVFVGDPVEQVAEGAVAVGAATGQGAYDTSTGDAIWPIAEVATSTETSLVYGVVVGVHPTRSNLSLQYLPASTGGLISVCRPTSETLFVVGEDGDTDALTLIDIGAAVDFIAGAGSTTTGYSGWIIDSDSHGTAEVAYLRGLYNEPGNSDLVDSSLDVKWVVSLQYIQFQSAVTPGVGIN
jgi:hypothetical protein